MYLNRIFRVGVLLASLAAACGSPSIETSTASDIDREDDDDDDRLEAGEHRRAPAQDPSGPTPTPLQDGVRFSSTITHPYLPLSAVRYTELQEDEDEKVVREVLDRTQTVSGIECLVLAEKEYEEGDLKEISYNYFAQDDRGNVYYFGEDVDDYENGTVVGHGGAWLVGRNAKEPCLFMPARLQVGFAYKPENSPPSAEEWDEIAAIDAELRVPAGTYRDVLVVKEGDRPGRWEEQKYYARGVGLISENRELNLVVIGK